MISCVDFFFTKKGILLKGRRARLDLTVNFQHEQFIDPSNCPWVFEDGVYIKEHCLKRNNTVHVY